MNSSEKNTPVHHLTSEQFQLMKLDTGHPENFNDVHRHNFFEIIRFSHVRENSSLELDFESHSLKNNQICIIAPGQKFTVVIC